MIKRFIQAFIEFADVGFRYIDTPWFHKNEKEITGDLNRKTA